MILSLVIRRTFTMKAHDSLMEGLSAAQRSAAHANNKTGEMHALKSKGGFSIFNAPQHNAYRERESQSGKVEKSMNIDNTLGIRSVPTRVIFLWADSNSLWAPSIEAHFCTSFVC